MEPEKSKNKEENSEEIKRKALEKANAKIAIVNIEDLAEKEARDAADKYMTEDAKNLKGIKGKIKKIWKHTYVDEFYRQRELKRIKKEIKETGDIYTREDDKEANHKMMKAVVERFTSEYEDEVLSDGEEKKILNEDDIEAVKTKEDIKKLITDYANGELNDEAFKESKKRIISNLKNKDLLKGADNYADNIFEIAQNAKIAIEHGAKMEEIDLDTNIILGKAKSSIKTESNFNLVDRAMDKYKKTKIGRVISPPMLATAIGIAYCVALKGSQRLASSRVAQIVTLGGAAVVAGAFAGLNESQRVTNEKRQHAREMAKGGTIQKGDKRREKMNQSAYQIESSKDLQKNLRDLLFVKNEQGQDEAKDLNEEEMKKVLALVSDIEARNKLADKRNIDLISYSSAGDVEKESTDMWMLLAQSKRELRKLFEDSGEKYLPQGENSFDEYFKKQVEASEDAMLGGEKGIIAQDKVFRKNKIKRVAIKVAVTITMGFVIGAGIQEAVAFGSDSTQGLVEEMVKGEHTGATNLTPLAHLKDLISGHTSHMGLENSHEEVFGNASFKLPEGVSMVKNPDGTFNVLRGDVVISDHIPLHTDASGALDQGSIDRLGKDGILGTSVHNIINGIKEINTTAGDYINNHGGDTHVSRDGWYGNDTPKPIFDKNELKLWYGGENNNGINADGKYEFNIKHMTSGGSYQGEFSVDAQEKMKDGLLKIAFSLTEGTQSHVFEVPIDIHGNAVIDPNSEVGKLFFSTENGHAVFKGRFAEVVESFGTKDGVEHIKTLATYEGPGNDSIVDVGPDPKDVAKNTLDIPLGVDMPYFVPILSRTPLGKLAKNEGGKETPIPAPIKKDGEDEKGNKTIEDGVPPVIPIKENKKEKIVSYEMSKKEYEAIKDDMNMINKKEQSSQGIITVNEDSFKSEYAKKRYKELKSIADGKPVVFNDEELRKIGNELEGILSKGKVVEQNITEEMIKERAYFNFLKRTEKGISGDEKSDYYNAEKELNNEKFNFREIVKEVEVKKESQESVESKDSSDSVVVEKKEDKENSTKEEPTTQENGDVEVGENIKNYLSLLKKGAMFETKNYKFKVLGKAGFFDRLMGYDIKVSILDKNTNKEVVSYMKKIDLQKGVENKEFKRIKN